MKKACDICGIYTEDPTVVSVEIRIQGVNYEKERHMKTEKLCLCHTCVSHLPDYISGAMVREGIVGPREVFRYHLPSSKIEFQEEELKESEKSRSLLLALEEPLQMLPALKPRKKKRRSHEEVARAEAAKKAKQEKKLEEAKPINKRRKKAPAASPVSKVELPKPEAPKKHRRKKVVTEPIKTKPVAKVKTMPVKAEPAGPKEPKKRHRRTMRELLDAGYYDK